MGRAGNVVVGTTGFLVVLIIWTLASTAFGAPKVLLPPPWTVLETFREVASDGELLGNIGTSSLRVLYAFVFAFGIGIPAGMALGLNRFVRVAFEPFLNFFIAIPGLAWVPLSILWFGLNDKAISFILFTSMISPMIYNTFQGVRMIPKPLTHAVQSLGGGKLEVLRSVVVPGMLPSLVTGVRLGVGNGWRALVAAEMIVATNGLGFMIFNARDFLRTDIVIVGMIVIGLTWLAMDRLILRQLERRTIEKWGVTDM